MLRTSVSRTAVFVALGYCLLTAPNASGQWGQVKKLEDSTPGADNFGGRVAIDGDQALAGAYYTDVGGFGNNGVAYVFGKDVGGTDNWGQTAYLVPSNVLTNQYFGQCATMDGDGDTLAVGSWAQNNLYLYDKVAGEWGNPHGTETGARSETKIISSSDVGAGFGYSSALDGDTMIAGAFLKAANLGGAYIYERNQGGADNWGETILTLPGTAPAAGKAGIAVDVEGDWATVGSFVGEEAYVFNRDEGGAGNWGYVATLTRGTYGAATDKFGITPKIQGNTIIVSAQADDTQDVDAGAGYIFNLSGGVWGQGTGTTRTPDTQILPTDADAAGGQYGSNVAIHGDVVAVGGYIDDKVELFGRNVGGAGNWGSLGVHAGSDTVSGDWFGLELDMASDSRLIVSSEWHQAHSGQGAAYIFQNPAPNPITVEYWAGNEPVQLDPYTGTPPGGTPTHDLDSVPFVQTETSVLDIGGMQYLLEGEGLYRVYDQGDLVRQTVRYDDDVYRFTGHLSRVHVHGTRHGGYSLAQWIELARDGEPVSIQCGNTTSFVRSLLSQVGVDTRVAQCVAKGDWNHVDDGHSMVELYDTELERWILVDVSLGIRHLDSSRIQNVLGSTQLYRRDDGSQVDEFVFDNASSKLDPGMTYQDYYNIFGDRTDGLLAMLDNDVEAIHEWYDHVMEIPMQNNSYIASESQEEIDLIRTLWPGITALSFVDFYRMFYPGELLPGDLDDDLFVGGNDLDIIRANWGQHVTPGDLLSGDPSGDGFVGGDDLDLIRAHWGQGIPSTPGSVPEPLNLALWSVLVILGPLVVRRRV